MVFPLFLVGVLVCSWRYGLRAGLLATVASTVVIDFFFLAPLYQLEIASVEATLDLTVFAIVAVAVGTLSAQQRHADARARVDRAAAEATWRHLQAIIDATEDGLMVFDRGGRVQFANSWLRAWCAIHFGEVPPSASALAATVVDAREGQAAVALLPTDLAFKGLGASQILTIRVQDGGTRRVRWRAVPIGDGRGHVSGVVAVWRDVTEQPDPLLARRLEYTVPVAGAFDPSSRN